ncbi:MAG: zinc ribbon domain-containing protein [Clostridiales bacterium]|jgi:hypothetical protein|nr:zinc ribbon domain-containing protein [Clostridiales bacterium]
MTFCTNCGANLDANSQFCTQCGNTTGAPAPLQYPVMPAPSAPPNPAKNNKLMRAIVAALAVLMIATMLQGWLSIHIDMTPWGGGWNMMQNTMRDINRELGFRQVDIMGVLSQSASYTMSMHELGNLSGMLNWYVDLLQPMTMMMDPIEFLEFRAMADSINSFGLGITAVRLLQAACALALAAFLFLLLTENRAAGLVGQLATLAVFLTSAAFAIGMALVSSALPFPTDLFGGEIPDLSLWIDIGLSASLWVWATLILSAAGFLLITLRKSAFREANN